MARTTHRVARFPVRQTAAKEILCNCNHVSLHLASSRDNTARQGLRNREPMGVAEVWVLESGRKGPAEVGLGAGGEEPGAFWDCRSR